MRKIDFLYLGGDKCGSTWIYSILKSHPDVCLPVAKELFFFDRFYDKGWDWYLAQFPRACEASRIGEICHDYLYSDLALRRISRDLGNQARYLICLREPMERAVSHYRHMLKIGRTNLSFEAALDAFPEIIDHSLYAHKVERAFELLGQTNVKVLFFDSLREDPVSFGEQLSNALDIGFDPSLPYEHRVLEGGNARSPAVVKVLRDLGWMIRGLGLPGLVGAVKENALITRLLYSGRTSRSRVVDALGKDAAQALSAKFSSDIVALEELLGVSLPAWHLALGDGRSERVAKTSVVP